MARGTPTRWWTSETAAPAERTAYRGLPWSVVGGVVAEQTTTDTDSGSGGGGGHYWVRAVRLAPTENASNTKKQTTPEPNEPIALFESRAWLAVPLVTAHSRYASIRGCGLGRFRHPSGGGIQGRPPRPGSARVDGHARGIATRRGVGGRGAVRCVALCVLHGHGRAHGPRKHFGAASVHTALVHAPRPRAVRSNGRVLFPSFGRTKLSAYARK